VADLHGREITAADCHVSWQSPFSRTLAAEIFLPEQRDGPSRFRLRLTAASSPNFVLMDGPWMRMRSQICYVLFLQTIPDKVMPFSCGIGPAKSHKNISQNY